MKLIIISMIIACLSAVAMGGEYIVIANSGSSLSEVSSADLKRLYTGKTADIDGTKVAPANLSLDSPAAASFLSEITGMNGNDYRSFWFAEQIRGGSTAPATKKSTEAMMEYVKESPNAIGYVPKGTATDGVKVLKVK